MKDDRNGSKPASEVVRLEVDPDHLVVLECDGHGGGLLHRYVVRLYHEAGFVEALVHGTFPAANYHQTVSNSAKSPINYRGC